MIYLIHGANQVDSRRFLIKLKGNYQDIQTIQGKSLGKKMLEDKLRLTSHNLFGGRAGILIENFIGDWSIFPEKMPEGADIILWSGDKVELGKMPVKNFLFDQKRRATSFRLADAILFKNEKEAQGLVWELISSREPTEKIIGAILRGLLLTFCAKDDLKQIPLSSFVRQRIEEQTKNWTRVSLKKAILELLRADRALKEGQSPGVVFSQLINKTASLTSYSLKPGDS